MRTHISSVLIFLTTISFAQEISIPVRFIINIEKAQERYVGKDTFDWEYTITNNTLRKEKDGKYVEYKNVSLGSIYKTDIQNPLQIVVFYKGFNTVILLDNQMNETARINLSDIPIPVIADAAGLASQNRLWIFDMNTQRLGLYSQEKNEYKLLTPPFSDPIKYYQSDYNYFYWIDIKNQCFASNLFGKVSFLGNMTDFDEAQIITTKYIIYKKESKLSLYNIETGSSTPIEIVENSFAGFHYAAQILSIFTERETHQYQITLPE